MNYNDGIITIWTRSEKTGTYAISVKDVRLARKLNDTLRHYPADTPFTPADEPVFYFTEAEIERIASLTPKLGRILVQIGWGRAD